MTPVNHKTVHIHKINVFACIFLTLLICGIFEALAVFLYFSVSMLLGTLVSSVAIGICSIFWMYLLIDNASSIQDKKSSRGLQLLFYYIVPFYSIYWWYSRGNGVKNSLEFNGEKAIGNGTLYIIFSILGLNIVSMIMMQLTFNSLDEEKYISTGIQEKCGAFIQFAGVVGAFILLWLGIGGAYQEYFAYEVVNIAKLTFRLILIAAGVGVGVGGVIFGNLLKR